MLYVCPAHPVRPHGCGTDHPRAGTRSTDDDWRQLSRRRAQPERSTLARVHGDGHSALRQIAGSGATLGGISAAYEQAAYAPNATQCPGNRTKAHPRPRPHERDARCAMRDARCAMRDARGGYLAGLLGGRPCVRFDRDPKVRDARFITIRRGGALTDLDHRPLALWAAVCAEHVLGHFEAAQPCDRRPLLAIEHIRAWTRGEVGMMESRAAGKGRARCAMRDARCVDARCAGLCRRSTRRHGRRLGPRACAHQRRARQASARPQRRESRTAPE